MVQRLQSTLDARMGVLQHLAQQTADQANQMTATVNALQQKLNAQSDAMSGKLDTVSGQVQSLNDSVDELKARIAKLDKIVAGFAGATASYAGSAAGAKTQPGATRAGAQATPGPGQGPGLPEQPWDRTSAERCRRAAGAAAAGDSAGRRARLQCRTVPGGARRVPGRGALLSAGRSGRDGAVLPGRDCLPAEGLRDRDQRLQRRCWKGSAATPRLRRRNCTRDLPCWR